MPRRKILSDADVLAMARRLCAEGGSRALTFGSLALACGLAASTLAQRFGSVDGLLSAAARDGWVALALVAQAQDEAAAGKGPQGLLKALTPAAREVPLLLSLSQDDAARAAAADWRATVEAALARRMGSGDKGRQAATALFAAWQGQILWQEPDLRIKDIARRLS